jgi:hypothetical protein
MSYNYVVVDSSGSLVSISSSFPYSKNFVAISSLKSTH